jgi:hypothetical protein
MSDLTEAEIHELWAERAAIREYEGGESRQKAEFSAAMEIKRQIGFIPESIQEVMEITKRGKK